MIRTTSHAPRCTESTSKKINKFHARKLQFPLTKVVSAITTFLSASLTTSAFAMTMTGNVVDGSGNPLNPSSISPSISTIYIGDSAYGKIDMSGIDSVLAMGTVAYISHGSGSAGSALEIGPMGRLALNSIYVGFKEYGLLTALGSISNLGGNLFIETDKSAAGLSTATFSDSGFNVAQSIFIGNTANSQGQFIADKKSLVSAGDRIIFGGGIGSIGTGIISDTGTYLSATNGTIIVGDQGTGDLTIKNGAEVLAQTVVIGASSTGEGHLTLSDTTSLFNINSKELTVGESGKGNLTLNKDSTLNLNTITLSKNSGSTGNIYLDNGTLQVNKIIQGLGTGNI